MKHPHADLIKRWLDDTSQKIIINFLDKPGTTSIGSVVSDINGTVSFSLEPADPYADLRKAQAEGKRVVMLIGDEWIEGKKWVFKGPVNHYKIAEPDEYQTNRVYLFNKYYLLKSKKCGITGEVSVVNAEEVK